MPLSCLPLIIPPPQTKALGVHDFFSYLVHQYHPSALVSRLGLEFLGTHLFRWELDMHFAECLQHPGLPRPL